ncbi:MAG TPA: SMP-30/gluconolactonase/LRE family protein [Opitutaceae bacterium]|nr:SMP-30/gluconolactonase/LRE family protein [Opitutaceae bacterium]
MDTPELCYAGRAELAEGPVWHEGALWWVNIVSGTLNRLDVSTGLNTARATGDFLSSAVPKGDGGWLVARRGECALLDWKSGKLTPFAKPAEMPSGNRFNDGKCDPAGRYWVGSMDLKLRPRRAALYRVDHDGRVERMIENLSLSNGVAWSAAGDRFFHVDTTERRLTAYDFDLARGTLSNARLIREFAESEGSPDGMAIDREDKLWIALWGGSAVVQVDPRSGKTLSRHELPVAQVSACAFGGEDSSTLFITTAWQNLSLERRIAQPLAGSIFALKTQTRGAPVSLFGPTGADR